MAKFLHTIVELQAEPWTEVSAAKYTEMLEVLPPARHVHGAFAVGECLCHTDDGQAVHEVYVEMTGVNGKRYFTKPWRLCDFDRLCDDRDAVINEICEQIWREQPCSR